MGWTIRSERNRPLTSAPPSFSKDRKALPIPRKLSAEDRQELHTLRTVIYALLGALLLAVAGIAWWLWLAN
jgi:hypothetical protein